MEPVPSRSGYPFELDRFQLEAFDAWDRGESVLVAAPTSSGKTVVAEYAIDRALEKGRRAFYTAPIKALSNQKFHDLVIRLGADSVGLLTGDNTINPDAPVVVMTTEVLRNMIYAGSSALDQLAVVVLDEVHFLQDTYRGPVWEEVIIHLPAPVRLVCLSATVSNADEVATWLTTVRGPTRAIIEQRRPVELTHLHMILDRARDRLRVLPTLVDGRANTEIIRLDTEAARPVRRGERRAAGRSRRRLATPWRLDVVDYLDEHAMLPAIYFVFSRARCDEAAGTLLDAGVQLTDDDERARIARRLDEHLGELDAADLDALDYDRFAARLLAGIAAHHAGMITPFRELVEACFTEGLVKVVFATETLAVGINMPATTVVIDSLSKFTGDHHELLNPGEFTQLTGRAGRRGLDPRGYAITLWSPFVPFQQVAHLASSRTFHLRSAFRPTYNMAANLVQRYDSDRVHHLLNLSFAQYQADRDLVTTEARLETARDDLARERERAASPFGDIDSFRLATTRGSLAETVPRALADLRPGEVIYVAKGAYAGPVAVIATSWRKGGLRVSAITGEANLIQLGVADFPRPPAAVGAVELPLIPQPREPQYRREVAEQLPGAIGPGSLDDSALAHPVVADPDIGERLAAAARADRLAAEFDQLRGRVTRRQGSVGRDFDRVLEVLRLRGYVDGWQLTEWGRVLARVFHECDLLIAECLRAGLLDGLGPEALAGLVSVFVYEHRSPQDPPSPWFPNRDVRDRWRAIVKVADDLDRVATRHGVGTQRAPDPTFVAIAFAWAAGEGFGEIVADDDISGGDFVRTMKQLIDLLRQLALVAPQRSTRSAAQSAADRLMRGVVAASFAVEPIEP